MGRGSGTLEDLVNRQAPGPLPTRDLDAVLDRTRTLWQDLRGARIFVTGGTGFVGRWMIEAFAWANDRLRLGATACLLTRTPEAFRITAPHLASHPAVSLVQGDVREFTPPAGSFARIVHGAASASTTLNREEPGTMFETIVAGTRRTLDMARSAGAEKVLLISSGAVYGPQPAMLSHVAEDHAGGPLPLDRDIAYAEGKRVAEMTAGWHACDGLHVTIARPFAFIGPLLPLDRHFAAGNFVRDALEGRPIRVAGDGRAVRSYMYAADLSVWLWTILERGASGRPYNVGSDEAVSIRELAQAVARSVRPSCPIVVEAICEPTTMSRYVPSVARARAELGLTLSVGLDDAIARTLEWHSANRRRLVAS